MNRQCEFKRNRVYANKFTEQFKAILRKHIAFMVDIRDATTEEDMQYGADLKYEIPGAGSVGIRIRRKHIVHRDFTIRSKVPSGYTTEWDKIKSGCTDWYLYAWAIDDNINQYVIIDVNKLRQSGLLNKDYPDMPNGDGTFFKVIPLYELKRTNCIKVEHNIIISMPNIRKTKSIFSGVQIILG